VVLEVLKRRAHIEFNLSMIERLIERARIGFEGEKRVDRIWQELNLPPHSLLIHSFECENEFGFSHQMDSLFVNRFFLLVLEIKTVTGYIYYDEKKHQLIREKRNGEIESFQSPIDQVNRHADFLERFGLQLGLTYPVEKAVVIAEPSCIIGQVPDEVPVFHASGLSTKLKRWFEKHNHNKLPDKYFKLLTESIVNLHNPKIYKPRFSIPPIQKGALCYCRRVMKYNQGKFECVCGVRSKEPLYQGLSDYRCLISQWITNKEFREFFQIDNEVLVNKLLKRLNFYYEGSTKSRRYLIPEDVWPK